MDDCLQSTRLRIAEDDIAGTIISLNRTTEQRYYTSLYILSLFYSRNFFLSHFLALVGIGTTQIYWKERKHIVY